MSDTSSNDPYDPNRPWQPSEPPPPPPPQWTGGQLGQYGAPAPGQGYGQPGDQPSYGQSPYGQSPYGQPAGQPPPNYLVWGILSTLFCCLPLGVASIIFSSQVSSKYAMGDIAGAQASSDKARKFAIWSAVAGVVLTALLLFLAVLLPVLAARSGPSY